MDLHIRRIRFVDSTGMEPVGPGDPKLVQIIMYTIFRNDKGYYYMRNQQNDYVTTRIEGKTWKGCQEQHFYNPYTGTTYKSPADFKKAFPNSKFVDEPLGDKLSRSAHATATVVKTILESDEVRPILLAPFEAIAFAQVEKFISLSRYINKIGAGTRTSKYWNLGQAVVDKSYHNWEVIFGRKATLDEVMPYVRQAVNEGEWHVTGAIYGRRGVYVGEKLELIQNVKGHNIWVGSTREASTGKIIINNAAVAK